MFCLSLGFSSSMLKSFFEYVRLPLLPFRPAHKTSKKRPFQSGSRAGSRSSLPGAAYGIRVVLILYSLNYVRICLHCEKAFLA